MFDYRGVSHIRQAFAEELKGQHFVTDKTGVKTIELVSASFIATEPYIFGEVNYDYVQRELDWYISQSLKVADIPGGPPDIWQKCASKDGYINSNYGFLIWSNDNYNQYENVLEELKKNPLSRRAVMIYNRPAMHYHYNTGGMSDFICTNAVQYVIRDGCMYAIVQMRSNDAWAGFRNDYAWQEYVLEKLVGDYNEATQSAIAVGAIFWNAGSLHLYERQFYLADYYAKTGIPFITKKQYSILYPESPWASM